MITILEIKYFVEVVKQNNFSAAAKALFITESTISHQIKKLEQQVGQKLIIRSTRKMQLTEAGKLFYDKALSVLDSYHDLYHSLDQFALNHAQTLSIGMVPVMNCIHFIDLFNQYTENHPKISADLLVTTEEELCQMLLSKEIDFALVKMCEGAFDYFDPTRYSYIHLKKEQLKVLAGKTMPLPDQSALGLNELIETPLIIDKPGSYYHYIAERFHTQAGFKINQYPLQTNNLETIMMTVESGKAITYASESASDYYQTRYAMKAYDFKPKVTQYISLIYLKNKALEPHHKTFIQFIQKKLALS